MPTMLFLIIGDRLYCDGYHVATFEPDPPASVRIDVRDVLDGLVVEDDE